MLRPVFFALGLMALTSCDPIYPKAVQHVNFTPDNSGTFNLKMSGKRLEPNDEKSPEELEAERKAATQLRKEQLTLLGLSVNRNVTLMVEGEDGQEQSLEVSAHIADLNLFLESARKKALKTLADAQAGTPDKEEKSPAEQLLTLALFGGPTATRVEAGISGMVNLLQYTFWKTADPGVGRLEIIPPISELMKQCRLRDNPLVALAALSDKDRSEMETSIVRARQSLFEELSWEIKTGVPGEIVATNGCTKSHDGKSVIWRVVRDDIDLESLKAMLARKDGVWVDFKIPAGCKINFKDPPQPATNAVPKPEPKKEDPAQGK